MKTNAILLIAFMTALMSSSGLAIEIPATADASVSSVYPSQKFGGAGTLPVDPKHKAYLRFDLAPLPAGTDSSQITNAILRLYVEKPLKSGTMVISPASAPWAEGTINAFNSPAPGSAIGAPFVPSAGGSYLYIDLTSTVKTWVSGSAANNGLVLTLPTAGRSVIFDSKENSATGHSPVLDVTVGSFYKSLAFNVAAADWDAGYHYGDGNVYRSYTPTSAQTGGISLPSFFLAGGNIQASALVTGSNGYSMWRSLPCVYSKYNGSSYIGVKFDILPAYGMVVLSQTTNGWDSNSIALGNIQAITQFKINLSHPVP